MGHRFAFRNVDFTPPPSFPSCGILLTPASDPQIQPTIIIIIIIIYFAQQQYKTAVTNINSQRAGQ